MYCNKCGNYISGNDKFCSNCGCNINNNINRDDSSLIFGIISFVFIFIPIISIPFGIISIVRGIKNKNKGSNGIILSVVSLIFSIIYIFIVVAGLLFIYNYNDYDYDNFYEEDSYEYYDEFNIKGNYFELSNGSNIYFGNDMIYSLYDDGNNYSGYYELYEGIYADRYVIDNYYDKDIDLFYEYSYDDIYLIVLKNNDRDKDLFVYYGYYYDNKLNMIDILSNDKVIFTLGNGYSGSVV